MKKNTRGLALDHRVQEVMFPADQVMFWVECISWAKALREMEANFGILPAPKYDEQQSQYYSCNNGNFFGMSVPVSVSDVERTSIILEALQSAEVVGQGADLVDLQQLDIHALLLVQGFGYGICNLFGC